MRVRHSLSLTLMLGLGWSLPAGALTVPLRLGTTHVGSLGTIGPTVSNAPSGNGGVNFWASFSLDPGAGLLDAVDLRWIQRVTFSGEVPGFPSPNRPFIDPREGQSVGSVSGDAAPWYDISGGSQATLSLTGGGDDPWMGDGPFAPYTLAPFTFSADTLLVTIDAAHRTAVILGGVQWGYALSTAGGSRTTPAGPVALGDSDVLRAAFNDALALDFPDWHLVAVPEPATAELFGLALLTMAWATRMRASIS